MRNVLSSVAEWTARGDATDEAFPTQHDQTGVDCGCCYMRAILVAVVVFSAMSAMWMGAMTVAASAPPCHHGQVCGGA